MPCVVWVPLQCAFFTKTMRYVTLPLSLGNGAWWDMLNRRNQTHPNRPEALPAFSQTLLEGLQNFPLAQINRVRTLSATNAKRDIRKI